MKARDLNHGRWIVIRLIIDLRAHLLKALNWSQQFWVIIGKEYRMEWVSILIGGEEIIFRL